MQLIAAILSDYSRAFNGCGKCHLTKNVRKTIEHSIVSYWFDLYLYMEIYFKYNSSFYSHRDDLSNSVTESNNKV